MKTVLKKIMERDNTSAMRSLLLRLCYLICMCGHVTFLELDDKWDPVF